MAKKGVFFVVNQRQQKLWRGGQILVCGKLICGELHVGEHIVVYGKGRFDVIAEVVCRGIVKKHKVVANAWPNDEVFLVLPTIDGQPCFLASSDIALFSKFALEIDDVAFNPADWAKEQQINVVFSDYYRFTSAAQVIDVELLGEHRAKIVVSIGDSLFLKLGQTVELSSVSQQLSGRLVDLIA